MLVNCNVGCSKNRCTCKKNSVNCTDLCGCGDECQNTDTPPSSAFKDIDGDDEQQFEEIDEYSEKELEGLEHYLEQLEELEEPEDSD